MAALPTVASSAHSRALGIITLITWLLTASIGAYMFGKLAASGGLRQQRAVRDGLPPAVLFGHFSLALTALVVWVSYLATGWVALAWTAVGLLMPTIGLGICTVTLWTPYPRFPAVASADAPTGTLTDEMLARALTDDVLAGGARGPGGAPTAPRAVPSAAAPRGTLTEEMLARALTDDVRAGKLVDEVLANVPADLSRAAGKRAVPKRRGPVAVLIPVGHGMAAVATFALAVVTAAGMR